MEKSKIKLRFTEATDVKSIIELLAQLDRPLPKTNMKLKNSKNSSKVTSCLVLLKRIGESS
jgi:hypothetical protein